MQQSARSHDDPPGPNSSPVARIASFERRSSILGICHNLIATITHLTAQHSCRTALHGSLVRRIC